MTWKVVRNVLFPTLLVILRMHFTVTLKLWETFKRQVFKGPHQFRYAFFNSNISSTFSPQFLVVRSYNTREQLSLISVPPQHLHRCLALKMLRSLGLGEEEGILNREKCTFYFNISRSVSVTGMANHSTRSRSYRSSSDWNGEDIDVLSAWIYSYWLTTSVRMITSGFPLGV